MRYQDGYVIEPVSNKGAVWGGRLSAVPSPPHEPFEATLQSATTWVPASYPDCATTHIRVQGVPLIAETLRQVWLWTSGGAPCDVAAVSHEGIHGLALRGPEGRVAILAQCEDVTHDITEMS